MSKSTMIEFVQELEKILPSENSFEIALMIKEAKAGEYHDYKNNKYDCGKMEASRKLRLIGEVDLAKRIESGEFDESPDEEDKKTLSKFIDENCGDTVSATKLKRRLGLI